MHGFTYSGHPVGGALGLVNLDIMEREGLVEQRGQGRALPLERLRARVGEHPYVGEVRGEGLVIAVEFVADKAAGGSSRRARTRIGSWAPRRWSWT